MTGHRKSENAGMEEESLLLLEKEKNLVGNMLSVVCLSVVFVEEIYHVGDGIVVRYTRKQYGIVLNLPKMAKGFVQIAKEYQKR